MNIELDDQITRVLQQCETTLRTLAEQRRLSSGALATFAQLSATVRQEMERRQGSDRRVTPRDSPDRRALEHDN